MPNFFFNAPLGPTETNLSQAFKRQAWKQEVDSNLFNNDNLLSDDMLSVFEHKHRLHNWLQQNKLNISPKTVILDELTLHQTLNALSLSHYQGPWILKPALLNNGHGINLFHNLVDVASYFKQNDRYSGLHVLQAYVANPMLWKKRKFSLRMFVVLSHKRLYFHPEGYLNVCQTPYSFDDLTNLNAHLTNEHLSLNGAKNNEQILTSDWPMFHEFVPEIKRQCDNVFLPFVQEKLLEKNTFGILGVDFMLDDNKRLWLLEVNHGPCFPTSNEHPLYESLYEPLWDTVADKISKEVRGVLNVDKALRRVDIYGPSRVLQ